MPRWLVLIYTIITYLLSALKRLQVETAKNGLTNERLHWPKSITGSRITSRSSPASSCSRRRKLTNAADKGCLRCECRDRIYSMARLHEQLYSSGEFFRFGTSGAHLREMAEMLVHSPHASRLRF